MATMRTSSGPGTSPWQANPGQGRRSKPAWPEIGAAGAKATEAAAEPTAPLEPEAPAPLLFDEADLARAAAAVAAESRDIEREAAARRDADRVATALEAIATQLTAADAMIDLRTRQFREATATLAALATEAVGCGGGKIAARLADALTTDCLARFDPSLALKLEVAPEIADALGATLEASPALRSRPARIAVEAVATLGPGEARLVWPDGEAEWSMQRLHEEAAGLIRRLTEPSHTQTDATQGATQR